MTTHQKIEAAQSSTVQVKRIGNSAGLLLPKEVLAKLNLSVGDTLCMTLMPDGAVRLSPYDPQFDKAMKAARRGMKIYRNALAELAK